MKKKMREVTKKDVADAAMIAQLIGGADIAGAGFTCVEQERRKLHDCPDCDHFEHVAQCDHANEWDCVPAAIGASSRAADLWMEVSNAFVTTAKDRQGELDDCRRDGAAQELREREQLYAWVDSIRPGGIAHGDLGLNGLEVAAVLRDGHLPPGWKVVAKTTRRPRQRKAPNKSVTPVVKTGVVKTGGLPMVRVFMTGNRPQVVAA